MAAPCYMVKCPGAQICKDGKCVGDKCKGVTCPSGKLCVEGKCQHDPCHNIKCPINTHCENGQCVGNQPKPQEPVIEPPPTEEVKEKIEIIDDEPVVAPDNDEPVILDHEKTVVDTDGAPLDKISGDLGGPHNKPEVIRRPITGCACSQSSSQGPWLIGLLFVLFFFRKKRTKSLQKES